MWLIIRTFLFLVPVAIIGASVWLVGKAREFEYRDDLDLVVAVNELPQNFNPLQPSTGEGREVTEMIFDQLLRYDDELKLRGHLLESWDSGQRATFFFTTEEKAEAALSLLLEYDGAMLTELGAAEPVREGKLLHLTLKGRGPEAPQKVVEAIGEEKVAQALELQLTVAKDTVRASFDNFLTGSVEKSQIQLLRQPDERTLLIYILGEDTDLFIKELRLYYESNMNLEPSIEGGDRVAFSAEPQLTLKVREGVRWHDGKPMTAGDVAFTWREVTRAGSMSPLRDVFGPILSVEEVDDYTLRVVYQGYYAPMMEGWAKLPVIPQHLTKDFTTVAQWARFFAAPVGTGPFKYGGKNASDVLLESNEDYFRGAPRQSRMIYRAVENHEDRVLSVRLGTIDAMRPDASELWSAENTERLEVVRDVPRYQTFIAWNLRESIFEDERVRAALGSLIDVKEIVSAVTGPSARPCRGIFYPGVPFCDDVENPGHRHAPGHALKELAAAGWSRSDTGAWNDANGAPVFFTLTVDADNALQEAMAVEISFALAEVGIEVDIERLSWGEILSARLAPRDFDAVLLGWELEKSRDQWKVWHSSESRPGGGNFTGLKDPEVDLLLRKLRRVEKDEQVKKLAMELQEKIFAKQPLLFLCETGAAYAIRTGAVELARPRVDNKWVPIPVVVGPSGLMESRPWWVRSGIDLSAKN